MEPSRTREIVEALLFVSDAPVKARALADVVGEDVSASDVRQAVRELNEHYEETRASFSIEELAGGFQMLTRPEYDGFVRQLQKIRAKGRLSRAGLETLAIIAYKQPLTRPQVEEVRGVDAGGVLNTLLERGLCKIVGRAEGPGRPLLYGTTPQFMEHFGLRSLGQLPRIDDVIAALDRKLIAEDLAQELGGEPGEFDDPIRGILDPPEETDADAAGADTAGADTDAEVGDTEIRDTADPGIDPAADPGIEASTAGSDPQIDDGTDPAEGAEAADEVDEVVSPPVVG